MAKSVHTPPTVSETTISVRTISAPREGEARVYDMPIEDMVEHGLYDLHSLFGFWELSGPPPLVDTFVPRGKGILCIHVDREDPEDFLLINRWDDPPIFCSVRMIEKPLIHEQFVRDLSVCKATRQPMFQVVWHRQVDEDAFTFGRILLPVVDEGGLVTRIFAMAQTKPYSSGGMQTELAAIPDL
jgi:hypothetical protein